MSLNAWQAKPAFIAHRYWNAQLYSFNEICICFISKSGINSAVCTKWIEETCWNSNSATGGWYGCAIVMSYIEINKAVSQWGWPLTCAFLSLDLKPVRFTYHARTPLKSLICTGACVINQFETYSVSMFLSRQIDQIFEFNWHNICSDQTEKKTLLHWKMHHSMDNYSIDVTLCDGCVQIVIYLFAFHRHAYLMTRCNII